MNCPVCKTRSFEDIELEPGLWAKLCSKCNGKWISSRNYQGWLDIHGSILPEKHVEPGSITIPEFELARVCPKCRRILIKYKVGRNLPFKIDRCGSCAGVWLDNKEWIALKERNLHDELNKIFTDHWQEEVKSEEIKSTLRSIYSEKFGEEDYERIREFKEWVDEHEKSSEILAYIRDKNPLQF